MAGNFFHCRPIVEFFQRTAHILMIRSVALGTDDTSTPCLDFVVVFIHGKCSIS